MHGPWLRRHGLHGYSGQILDLDACMSATISEGSVKFVRTPQWCETPTLPKPPQHQYTVHHLYYVISKLIGTRQNRGSC